MTIWKWRSVVIESRMRALLWGGMNHKTLVVPFHALVLQEVLLCSL